MDLKFESFREACNYKLAEKQYVCGDCRYFVSEEQFVNTPSSWGTCPHHSHAFVKFRRACYSFEKQ